MSLPSTHLPAVPHISSPGRLKGERCWPALPALFRRFSLRRLDALLLGYPPAIALYRAAEYALAFERIKAAIGRELDAIARPADGGASADLAQPVPYHALHGETGEGFETRRARYDLPAGVAVILALGFLTPIVAIVIITHMG